MRCPSARLGHRIEDHLHRELGILRHQLRVALASFAISSDLVMTALPYRLIVGSSPEHCCCIQLGLEQRAEVGRAGRGCLSEAIFCIASALGRSLALIDRLIERFLRSTLMIIASTSRLPSGGADVFDAVARELGGTQVAFDVSPRSITAPLASTT
jgi:hypothetical protein